MRIVFIGTSELAVATAGDLVERNHEVIMVERDEQRIEELSDTLDCSFLHGDGSVPNILKEVGPDITDFLFCLTNRDTDNILAGLLGRSLGFKTIVVSIQEEGYETLCRELGLENLLVPSRTITQYLVDKVRGVDSLELSNVIKGDARLFLFIAGKDDAVEVKKLELSKDARVICLYRDHELVLVSSDTQIRKGDEVVLVAHSREVGKLQERWQAHEFPGQL